jgi:hypothetical protein
MPKHTFDTISGIQQAYLIRICMLFFGVSLINTCSQPETDRLITSTFSVSSGEEPAFTITNTSEDHISFRWSINEVFPMSRSNLVRMAASTNNTASNPVNLWRVTHRYVQSQTMDLADSLYRYPELIFNSAGYGNCGNQSRFLSQLWLAAGYPARIWSLRGHVVPEVRVDSSWQMYDPNTGVRFLVSNKTPASVSDIHPNHQFSLLPLNTTDTFPAGHPFQHLVHLPAYQAKARPSPAVPSDTFNTTWIVPPMASLTCCRPGTWPDGTPNRNLRVTIPPGVGGSLYIPLITLRDPAKPSPPVRLELEPSQQSRTFTYAVNPFLPLWKKENHLSISVRGHAPVDVQWETAPGNSPEKKPLLSLPIPWDDPQFSTHFSRFEPVWQKEQPQTLPEVFQCYLNTSQLGPSVRDSLWQEFQLKQKVAIEYLGKDSIQHTYSDQYMQSAYQFLQCYQIWHRLPPEHTRYYWRGMARILANR